MRLSLYYLVVIVGLLVTFLFIAYMVNTIVATVYQSNIANVVEKILITSIEQETSEMYTITLGSPVTVMCNSSSNVLKIGKVSILLNYFERLYNVKLRLSCPDLLDNRYITCSGYVTVLVMRLAPRHYVLYITCG